MDFIWESDFVFLLPRSEAAGPEADVPPRHGPSGCRVQAVLRVGVRVKFRGWRSDEVQGYGRVGGRGEVKVSNPFRAAFKWSLFTPVSS